MCQYRDKIVLHFCTFYQGKHTRLAWLFHFGKSSYVSLIFPGYWGMYLISVYFGHKLLFRVNSSGKDVGSQFPKIKIWALCAIFWLVVFLYFKFQFFSCFKCFYCSFPFQLLCCGHIGPHTICLN